MASINLSSLSEFWSSAKEFILSHFFRKYTLLYGSGSATTVTLSESIYNYKSIIICTKTNDDVYDMFYFDLDSFSANFLPVYGATTGTGNSAPAYLKAIMISISSDGKTITLDHTNEFRFRSGSGCNVYSGSGISINTIFGYK